MQLTGIDFLLWAAGFIGHVILLVVMFARQRVHAFPLFASLIGSNILRTLTLYLVVVDHGTRHTYLLVYACLATVDLCLQLGVVFELASKVFRPLGHWALDTRNSLAVMVVVCVAVAAGLTYLPDKPPSDHWLQSELIRANFFSATLMGELFVGMVFLSLTAELHWKTHAARIAQGLGLYSILCILIEAAHTYLGLDHKALLASLLSYVRIGSYLFTVGYWAVTLWMNAPAPRELPDEMRIQLFTLQRRLEYDLHRLRAWRRQ